MKIIIKKSMFIVASLLVCGQIFLGTSCSKDDGQHNVVKARTFEEVFADVKKDTKQYPELKVKKTIILKQRNIDPELDPPQSENCLYLSDFLLSRADDVFCLNVPKLIEANSFVGQITDKNGNKTDVLLSKEGLEFTVNISLNPQEIGKTTKNIFYGAQVLVKVLEVQEDTVTFEYEVLDFKYRD